MENGLLLRHNSKDYQEKRKADYKKAKQLRQSAKPMHERKKETLQKVRKG